MRLRTKVEQPIPVKLFIPYAKKTPLLQAVIDCLRIQFVQPELVKTRGGDDYWQLLSDQWAIGETFFIVEHDVIVWPGAIETMRRCENEWCTLPTLCQGRVCKGTFGCVKFGEQLLKRHPTVWAETKREWFHLDYELGNALESDDTAGHCVHWPAASHLNEIHWPDTISQRYNPLKVWKSMNSDGKPVTWMRNSKTRETDEAFAPPIVLKEEKDG